MPKPSPLSPYHKRQAVLRYWRFRREGVNVAEMLRRAYPNVPYRTIYGWAHEIKVKDRDSYLTSRRVLGLRVVP